MCTGNIHEDWYCCRPYLLTVLEYGHERFQLAKELKNFLNEGGNQRIMCQFDGYPPRNVLPSVVVEVQRDHWPRDGLPRETLYYYFALDQESGVWYDIGDERWLKIKSKMFHESGLRIPCREHQNSHFFTLYRTLEEIGIMYWGKERSPEYEASPLSRKDTRKEKGKAWSGWRGVA